MHLLHALRRVAVATHHALRRVAIIAIVSMTCLASPAAGAGLVSGDPVEPAVPDAAVAARLFGSGTDALLVNRGSASLDVYLTRKLFVTAATFEVFSDRFTNIELRVTPGAGVGYHLLRGKIDWVVEIGAGYQYTEFVSVFEENPSTTNSGAFVPSTRFDIDITKRLDFQTDYTLQITVPDIGQTNHHLLSVLSFELTKYLDLDLTFNWDRIEDPTPFNVNGQEKVPEKNDYRLVLALGIEF